MKRTILVVMLATLLTSCGKKSPTEPSNNTQTTSTKIIRLGGDLNFGEIELGGYVQRPVRVVNDGNTAMTVTGITATFASYFTLFSATPATIQPNGGFQDFILRFAPLAAQTYNGTITIASDATSGTSTYPYSAVGVRTGPLWTGGGTGDFVFEMPVFIQKVRITGTYTGNSSNFVVKIGGRLIVNELIGTGWGTTKYDGTLLTGGGGTVAITLSSGVAWTFTEVR